MDDRAFVRALFSSSGDAFVGLDAAAWAGVHAIASSLQAEALLAARLRVWGARISVPEDVSAALDHAYKNNVVHALAARHELDEILASFAAKRIDVAPLKGAELMRRGVHRDLGARYMHDLDLLVHSRDRAAARALLDARGYRLAPSGESPKHLPPMLRGRVYVELHEFAYWDADGTAVDLARWQRARSTLSPTVVHLVHHLFRSSVNEPLLALKTFWDFHEIETAHPDALEIDELARRAGLVRELGLCRALSRPDAPERAEALELCRPISAAALDARVLRFHLALLTRAPLWYRALHARSILAPSRRAMARIAGRPLEGWDLARAYAARPFELAGKGVRAAVRAIRARAPR
ncbi:MAG: nucleotidyltransferase family protein [Polyangiaceae bacterium]